MRILSDCKISKCEALSSNLSTTKKKKMGQLYVVELWREGEYSDWFCCVVQCKAFPFIFKKQTFNKFLNKFLS
jgi:hypothetical protein